MMRLLRDGRGREGAGFTEGGRGLGRQRLGDRLRMLMATLRDGSHEIQEWGRVL